MKILRKRVVNGNLVLDCPFCSSKGEQMHYLRLEFSREFDIDLEINDEYLKFGGEEPVKLEYGNYIIVCLCWVAKRSGNRTTLAKVRVREKEDIYDKITNDQHFNECREDFKEQVDWWRFEQVLKAMCKYVKSNNYLVRSGGI